MLECGERVDQVADLARAAQAELGARRPAVGVGLVGIGDEDPDAAAREYGERVLVGDIVADVQRDDVVAVESQRLQQVQDRLALVGVQVRLQLVHQLAGRHLQLADMPSQQLVDDRLDTAALCFVDEPVVQGNRARLGLDERPGHVRDPVSELGRELLEQRLVALRDMALDGGARGAPDVEAVASRDDQFVEAHQPLDDGTVAPADYAHAAPPRQPLHRLAHAVRDHGVLRPVDDRRQRAVVVEEHGELLARKPGGERAELLERVLKLFDRCHVVSQCSAAASSRSAAAR